MTLIVPTTTTTVNNSNSNNDHTTTTTFNDIFKMTYIRSLIFNHIGQIFKVEYDANQKGDRRYLGVKGRDIIKLPYLGMISKYAMPLQFIRHYLPPTDKVVPTRRVDVIDRYCRHRNATSDTLEYLLEWSPGYEPVDQLIIQAMVSDGNIELLEFIFKRYPHIARSNQRVDLSDLCNKGDLSIVKLIVEFYSMENGLLSSHHAISCAARKGFIDIVKDYKGKSYRTDINESTYLYINDQPYINNTYIILLLFIDHTISAESSDYSIMFLTKDNNDRLDIVKFFHAQEKHQRVFMDPKVMENAAKNGLLDVVEFLHYNRTEKVSTQVMDNAAFAHLDIVKFLHYNRTEGATTRAMDNASSRGALEIVKFLHYNRTEGATTRAMDAASFRGALDVVKFLHFNRTEGATTRAMDAASGNNHIDVVKFLYEHRSEGATSLAIHQAIESGHTEMVEYLVQVVKSECSSAAVRMAIEKGRLDILSLLHDYYPNNSGVWTRSDMNLAAKLGHFEIVKFLHEHRQEGCTVKALDNHLKRGFMDIVLFLHQHRTEGGTYKAMSDAAQYGHFEILKFLYNNRRQEVNVADAIELSCCNQRNEIPLFLLDIFIKEKEDIGGLKAARLQLDNIESAIIISSICGHLEYVKYLVSTFNITTLEKDSIYEIKYLLGIYLKVFYTTTTIQQQQQQQTIQTI
ncbi:hypothetical protein DFA_03812 [Cavenderia fasciculata]|uniref:Ankyrin repeat-containing protein n=1 Tax=Cavenderia fasciculata TaxID=261658 RepID=F4Q0G7_CACFS|nr:uncharacterized protein DFA_03812 [Cavenderia fasciculata]EGG18318.1 hypothetical protein DFA_03812 [Cavenderia fasciculata]|eukprot:XP_004357141.1 hypothetical protein DFA_03812 [Cavenderia fasciculata]